MQIALGGCPSSPSPPSPEFLLKNSEALLSEGRSSPLNNGWERITQPEWLKGEQRFLWGEEKGHPKV